MDEDLLIKYLDNDLEAIEKGLLEERLSSDEKLREKMQSLIMARDAVKYYSLRKQVQEARQKFQSERTITTPGSARVVPIRKIIRFSIGIAAAILIIIAGYNSFTEVSPTKIYADVYVSYDLPATRSSAVSIPQTERLYSEKKYDSILQLQPNSTKEQLLLGLSAMQVGDYAKAIASFKGIVSGQNNYRDDAEFYLALSFLRNNQPVDARRIFQSIYNDTLHPYHGRITEKTLKDLDKLIR
jgi:TolA-binding protein